jgi:hypothetical protein
MKHMATCLRALAVTGVSYALIWVPSAPLHAQTDRDRVLAMAAAYIERLAHAMSSVVVQEDYEQVVRAGTTGASRRTRADLATIDAGSAGWVEFRDVYEVDGRPVRDHDNRLARLMNAPLADALRQAQRVAVESARFNLNVRGVTVDRTVNTPLTALRFLRSRNQSRSSFHLDGMTVKAGVRCQAVRFVERARPSLIESTDGTSARGTFWIEPSTGRVVASELEIEAPIDHFRAIRARLTVDYAFAATVGLWLPSRMDEVYDMRAATITGRATYSHVRQFSVSTNATAQ